MNFLKELSDRTLQSWREAAEREQRRLRTELAATEQALCTLEREALRRANRKKLDLPRQQFSPELVHCAPPKVGRPKPPSSAELEAMR